MKEAAPLGRAALLAVVHFLRRVTALTAGEPEPQTGPWEQLGQGVVSMVLEEQLACTWLAGNEVRLAGLGGRGLGAGSNLATGLLCSYGRVSTYHWAPALHPSRETLLLSTLRLVGP